MFIDKRAAKAHTPSSRGSPAPNTASPRALGAAGAALLACAMAALFGEGDWGTCATLLAAGGVSGCVLGSLYLLVRYASRVYSRFRLPKGEVVTGQFKPSGMATGGSAGDGQVEGSLISNEQMALASGAHQE